MVLTNQKTIKEVIFLKNILFINLYRLPKNVESNSLPQKLYFKHIRKKVGLGKKAPESEKQRLLIRL